MRILRIFLALSAVLLSSGCTTTTTLEGLDKSVFNRSLGTAKGLMPNEACAEALAKAKNKNMGPDALLFGVWREFNNECDVYDIAPLERFGPHVSAIGALDEILSKARSDKFISDYTFAATEAYVTLWY